MKGFSIPNISIPTVSLPSIPSVKNKVDVNSIKKIITSSIPDLENISKQVNLEQIGSNMLSDALSGGIELPSEIRDMIK